MAEEELITYVCAGGIILVCLVLIAFLVMRSKPVRFSKRSHGNSTSLFVSANQNLKLVSIVAKFGNEEVKFERKRIRKGQRVEFVYPRSDARARLTVEVESGHVEVYEV